MRRHFHEELDALGALVLRMGRLVQDQLRQVMEALAARDERMARDVIDNDVRVNALDVAIDEKCVELLALYQPEAGDLRIVTTAMKVVTDLERIGDQAVNIGQHVIELARAPALDVDVELPRMAELAAAMVEESLAAFVAGDTGLARRVCRADDEVDAFKERVFRDLTTAMIACPRSIPSALQLLLVSRFLERAADHATNIAEMVIYMVESKFVRHTPA
jgi:phosphate transport system protein